MKFTDIRHALKANKPEILSGVAVVGTMSTLYLSVKTGIKIGRYVEKREQMEWENSKDPDAPTDTPVYEGYEAIQEYAPNVWPWLIPPASAALGTVACIIAANRVSASRTAAAAAAYAVAERTLSDYTEQVKEKFGEKAHEEIQAEVAQKHVDENPPVTGGIIVTPGGSVLCQEAYTGRYFLSDMETLRRAQNDLNARLIQDDMVTLSEWYHMIGLGTTSHDHDTGWYSDKMMELQFSAVITEDGRPCMVFEYNYVKPLFL